MNAVILPPVLRYNRDHVGGKVGRLLKAFGLPDGAELAAAIEALNGRLKLPANLTEMGVPAEVLPDMAAAAVLDHSTATNPRPASASDYSGLFSLAMG